MMTTIELPVALEAIAECPRCGDVAGIPISLHARLVADDDGTGTLGVRLDAKKVPHICAQTRLFDGLSVTVERPEPGPDGDEDTRLLSAGAAEDPIPEEMCPYPECIREVDHPGQHWVGEEEVADVEG